MNTLTNQSEDVCRTCGILTDALFKPPPSQFELSEREHEVLALLREGYSNAKIADALVITTGTAKNHVHRILDKLGVGTRKQAVAITARMVLNSAGYKFKPAYELLRQLGALRGDGFAEEFLLNLLHCFTTMNAMDQWFNTAHKQLLGKTPAEKFPNEWIDAYSALQVDMENGRF